MKITTLLQPVWRRAIAMTLGGGVFAPLAALAQFTTPHVVTTAGAVTNTLGFTTVINQGLVGMGHISASSIDGFGESFGSVSGMQITGWANNGDGSYSGTFNILPDRGYNSGAFYSDYAARINRVGFTFIPYTGSTNIGGSTTLDKLNAQNQIVFTTGISGIKFTYDDPVTSTTRVTTGIEPGTGTATIFGQTMPYVINYTGLRTPSDTTNTTFTGINKLPLDAEALALKADGSGYIGDEYGANIYYFNSSKKIGGAIVPPAALQPHFPAATLYYGAASNVVNGRRINQGMEGVALSPDGSRLFALLQSAAVQDAVADSNDQKAKNTRLLVYDVGTVNTPTAPIAEYALTLPTYRSTGNGSSVNKTCAQSEVVALDNTRFLVLSRDGNGLGNSSLNPNVYKSVLLVDTTTGVPSEFASDNARNAEGGKITSAAGVLDVAITPLSWVEVVNMLNSTQLTKFNMVLDSGTNQVTKLTLGEKWEGMALVSANDAAKPNDYFLFVGNDNDFLTSAGIITGPDGTLVNYNGFTGYPATRLPAPVDSLNNENDTRIFAYRLTIATGSLAASAQVTRGGFILDRSTQRFVQQVTIKNGGATPLAGPILLALDGLSANATLANAGGNTAHFAPLGSPFAASGVVLNSTLAPGASTTVTLQFTNPSRAGITYNTRVIAGTPAP
ncbi:MAG TPA: esterase-like activity of phytase family protein [Candidatus Limnocylindria bacterium]|nr:esterase-like activity of phytase family protein [Candidatus Limnocylindria bacterium]